MADEMHDGVTLIARHVPSEYSSSKDQANANDQLVTKLGRARWLSLMSFTCWDNIHRIQDFEYESQRKDKRQPPKTR